MDTYPDLRREKMTIWLRTDKHCHKVTDDFDPVFYIEGSVPDMFSSLGFNTRKVFRKIAPGSGDKKEVVEVSTGRTSNPKSYISALDFFEGYGKREFYNVDIPLDHRYMVEKCISPMSFVEWDGDWMNLECQDRSYPDLRVVDLDVVTQGRQKMQSPIKCLMFNDETISGDERGMIEELHVRLKQYDPDVIVTRGGDAFVIPYLYYRGELLDVELEIGREPSVHMPKEGSSHESYGRVIYRPKPQMLKGRIHIDASNSFMYSQSGLEGLLEISRSSKITPQKMARYSPGRAVDHMEIEVALRRGYIIPWKKNMVEEFKTLKQLLKADRGGITYVPRVGVHREVEKVDFASMYPSIIVRYNISPDTIGCNCGDDRKVPELGYSICKARKGLIPQTIEPLLQKRKEYKGLSKGDDVYARKADALKWLLVTCFGYTGYKKARFSKIEVHESITAYGRETILDAAEIAMDMGYEVIHGIVDSLWLKGSGKGIPELLEKVNLATGIELEHEGTYRWVAFSPSNEDRTTGVPTRYFGVLDDELEVKGLHFKRHDTPQFFKEMQKRMLECFVHGNFDVNSNGCLEVTKDAYIRLQKRDVCWAQLAFTKKFSGRSGLSDVRAAHQRYLEAGVEIHPGQDVKYVVKSEGRRSAKERVSTIYDGEGTYDTKFYEKYLFKVAEEVMVPFGWWREDIERWVKYQ